MLLLSLVQLLHKRIFSAMSDADPRCLAHHGDNLRNCLSARSLTMVKKFWMPKHLLKELFQVVYSFL